jgi:hypothetical protein
MQQYSNSLKISYTVMNVRITTISHIQNILISHPVPQNVWYFDSFCYLKTQSNNNFDLTNC